MSTGVLMIIGGVVIGIIGLLLIIMTIKSNKVNSVPKNTAQMKSTVNMNQMQNMNQMHNNNNNMIQNNYQNNQESFDNTDNGEVDIFSPNFEENQCKKAASSLELKPKKPTIDLDDDLEDF